MFAGDSHFGFFSFLQLCATLGLGECAGIFNQPSSSKTFTSNYRNLNYENCTIAITETLLNHGLKIGWRAAWPAVGFLDKSKFGFKKRGDSNTGSQLIFQ